MLSGAISSKPQKIRPSIISKDNIAGEVLLAHSMNELMQSRGVRRPSVRLSVRLSLNFYTQVATSTTNMTGSPIRHQTNLHNMVITRWHGPAFMVCSCKVKVEIKGHVIRALLWCHEMFATQYLLTFCLYMHSLYEAPLQVSSISVRASEVRQLDVMSTSWNELLRHWRSGFSLSLAFPLTPNMDLYSAYATQ